MCMMLTRGDDDDTEQLLALIVASFNGPPEQEGTESPSQEAIQQPNSDTLRNVNDDGTAPPVPTTDNEALLDYFLSLHLKWAAYESTLEKLGSPDIVKVRHMLLSAVPRLSIFKGENTNSATSDVEDKKSQHIPDKEVSPSSDLPPSLEMLSDVLFQPGMKYCGNISIPGLDLATHRASENDDDDSDNSGLEIDALYNDNRVNGEDNGNNATLSNDENNHVSQNGASSVDKAYELTMLERGVDALGHAYLLATHRAYDDEQVCKYILCPFYLMGLKS